MCIYVYLSHFINSLERNKGMVYNNFIRNFTKHLNTEIQIFAPCVHWFLMYIYQNWAVSSMQITAH